MSNINKIQKKKFPPTKKPKPNTAIVPKAPKNKIDQLKPKEEKKEEKIELISGEDSTVFINSKINEIFATSEVTQVFTNNLSKSIELTISFPLKPEIQLTKFLITIGDKTIISKVLPKEKAQEKYTDVIASGNTGILSTLDESGKNYSINIGNILPKEKITLKSIFNQMITSQDMSYEFSFLEHYPCFIYSGNVVQSKKISGKFILSTKSKITRLISPFMDEKAKKTTKFEVRFNENYTEATIIFEKKMEIEIEKKEVKKQENKKIIPFNLRIGRPQPNLIRNIGNVIVNNALNNMNMNTIKYPGRRNGYTPLNYFNFLFRTEKMNKPMLYYQYDPEKKEVAYCLNYIYNSKNIKEIPIPEKPDQNCNASYYSKYQENLMNDTPGLFIFLVDQSGSMKGNSIDLVKKALVLFVQSLPQKSYFQLIGFGTDFKKYNETPIEYNKENVKKILGIIQGLQANMGGTNISYPLKDIFESKVYDDIPLAKNIFLLTDGQVYNRELCINLISVNSDRFRIHAMGIGNDFDKILIERAGKLGNGTSSFVEHINKIKEVVIETLNKCLRPYLININFGFANKSMIKNPILVNEPINNFTYQDEVISYAFILNSNNRIKFENLKDPILIEMWAKDPLNDVKESIKLTLDDNISQIYNGDNLLKIIVGQGLKFNKQIKDSEEKEIEFAKKYQMLSKNTALFGEIMRNEESQKTELIKVDINNERKKALNRTVMSAARPKNYMLMARGGMKGIRTMPLGTLALGNSMEKKSYKAAPKSKVMASYKAAPQTKAIAKNVMNLIKKSSYEQKSDGTIKIVDEFNDMLMSQDIMEGFWDETKETKRIINKIKKGGYEKIVKYIKDKKITENFKRVVYTILAIYYIEKEKAKSIKEYRLVINKGKKYLMSKGINYDEEINKINI